MACGATLQPRDQVVIEVTHMQISGHLALHELIEINAVFLWLCCQEWGLNPQF
jgi:hypothetical protein